MKKFIIALFALALISFGNITNAKELTLKETMDATCRVTAINNVNQWGIQEYAVGSGTVVQETQNSYLVLTNAHVVRDSGSPVRLHFFLDGAITRYHSGEVIWRFYVPGKAVDLAVIEVPKSEFKTFRPRVIPIAPKDYKLMPGTRVQGAGSPRGSWMQAWEAVVLDNNGAIVNFSMFPEPGQSGSSLTGPVMINGEEHTMVVGLLTWRSPSSRTGSGLALSQIHNIISYNPQAENTYVPSGYFPIADVKEADGEWEAASEKRCNHCEAPKSKHVWRKREIVVNGKKETVTQLECPTCKHGKYANQCPDGQCFPWKNRPQPRQDVRPPDAILGPGTGTPGVTLDELERQKKELEQKLQELESQKEKAIEDVQKSAEQTIRVAQEEAVEQVEIAKNEAEQAKANEETYKEVAEEANKEAQTLRDRIKEKIAEATGLGDKLEKAQTTIEELEGKGGSLIAQVIPGYEGSVWKDFGIIGVVIAVLIWGYDRFLLTAIDSNLTGIKGFFLKRILKRIIERKGIGKFREILEKYKKKLESDGVTVYNDIDVDGLVSEGSTNTKEEIPSTPAPPIFTPITPEEKQPVVVPSPIHVEQNVHVDGCMGVKEARNCAPNDFFKEFMDRREQESNLSVEYYLVLYILYTEAIELLKKGQLTHQPALPTENQLQTADVIETWVNEQYVARFLNSATIPADSEIYKKAYMGMLYKQAVEELRNGKLYRAVLNTIETAKAIENYVNRNMTEQLRKSK